MATPGTDSTSARVADLSGTLSEMRSRATSPPDSAGPGAVVLEYPARAPRDGETREPIPLAIRVLHCAPHRLRIAIGGLRNYPALEPVLTAGLLSRPGITSANASSLTGNVTVHHDGTTSPDAITDYLHALLRGEIEPSALPGEAARAPVWHRLDEEDVLSELKTAPAGLDRTEACARLAADGANTIGRNHKRSDLSILAAQFDSLPVALLVGAATLSLVTGALFEAAAVAAVIAANGAIGFATERQAERTIESLGETPAGRVNVKRGGRVEEISSEQLVAGDIMLLQSGMVVPADARLIAAQSLTVSEATLTGESVPVAKSPAPVTRTHVPLGDRVNMVYRGTIVTGGSATAAVVATGKRTEVGRIQRLVAATVPPQTPMQRELGALGQQLGWLTLGATGAMFGFGWLRGFALLQMARSALSLAVAAVPEGLPVVATTTLAFSADALRRRGILVRQMSTIEALAAADVICFDKTGTLTRNRMSVTQIAAGESLWHNEEGQLSRALRNGDARLNELLSIAALCNDATMGRGRDGAEFQGSGTETALLKAARSAGVDVEGLRRMLPRVATQHRTETYRFMATLHAAGEHRLLAVKGSPVEVAMRCSREMLPDGRTQPLSEEGRRQIDALNTRLASQGLRVLGLARAYLSREAPDPREGHLGDLTWLGCVGMADEVRPGVPALMRRLHAAGVKTILITGDQEATAVAVGGQVGIARDTTVKARDAAELEHAAPETLAGLVQDVDVFSRVSPTQKLQIIRALQQAGRTVVMVGDGINDGPALRAADVGVGIGRESEGVAREIADVYLASDDVESLVAAIEQGRTTHANVRKAIRYLLSTNLSEVLLMLGTTAAGSGAALNPMQLLWINLVTDVMPGLGLALEPPEPDAMSRPPMGAGDSIIGTQRLGPLFGEGALLAAGPLAASLYGSMRYGAGSPRGRTLAFFSIVAAQLLHALSCRSPRDGVFGPRALPPNPKLSQILVGSAALQGAAVAFPGLRRLLGLAPVGPVDIALAVAGGVAPFLIREAQKLHKDTESAGVIVFKRRRGPAAESTTAPPIG